MNQIQVINRIKEQIILKWKGQKKVLIAIDGRCGAGKSTLAEELEREMAEKFTCAVIHMDDFFLQPHQRTKIRLEEPGGNVDYERFLEEVLIPLQDITNISYRPYDCHSQSFKEPVIVENSSLIIVEGSYSCHPNLWNYYDLHIFLDITEEEQIKRIRKRNGAEAVKVFQEKWIPLEERYFERFPIRQKCDMIF